MKFIINESQLEFLKESLLLEVKNIKGCSLFSTKTEKQFCSSVESIIKNNLTVYREKIRKLIKDYFNQTNIIENIKFEILNENNPIVTNGFKQIDEVVKKISGSCTDAVKRAEEIKKEWISRHNIYFKDVNGEYHLLNRLDSNYTAIAILITEHYEDVFEKRMGVFTSKDIESFSQNWIDYFFDQTLELDDPFKNLKWPSWFEIPTFITPNPFNTLDKVLNSENLKIEEDEYIDKVMKTLDQVSKKGFETEKVFEEFLKYYDIKYEKFAGNYSFVDMLLGIDFIIQEKHRGRTSWIPIQVKSSSANVSLNLIQTFGCNTLLKPVLTKLNGKKDFMIEGNKGFEEYYCRNFDKIQTNTKQVYASSSYDYFKSKEYKFRQICPDYQIK